MGKSQRADIFDQAISDKGMELPHDLAIGIIGDYPYFLPALVLPLQCCSGIGEDERKSLTSRAAAAICDRTALYDLVGGDDAGFIDFYPREENRVRSTVDTISHFLSTFGKCDEEETKALERQIFNPVPDYEMLLQKESGKTVEVDDSELSDNDRLINKFLDSGADLKHHGEEATAKPLAEQPDSSLLSESLAKIYIRRHRYEKALEIIMSLSLNFPEKSVYFADQIRFLKKLIVNEKYKQKNNKTCFQH